MPLSFQKFIFGFFLASEIILFSGCALNYTDSKGIRHIIGFVDMKVDSKAGKVKDGVENLELTNIGFLLFKNPLHSGVSLGYNQESVMVFNGNSCVAFDPSNKQTVNSDRSNKILNASRK